MNLRRTACGLAVQFEYWIVHSAPPSRLAAITRTFCRNSIVIPGHSDTAVSNAARATARLSAVAIIRSPLGATSTTLKSRSIYPKERTANAESSRVM
jgi:hypothetical protein